MFSFNLQTSRFARLFTLCLLAATAATAAPKPAEAANSTPAQVAQALRARNWWQDLGSFGTQSFGYVHVFGNSAGGGWYTGSRVSMKGSYGSTTLGVAWYPFVLSNGTMGVVVDQAFSRSVYYITGFDAASERLQLWDGSTTTYWYSTRSRYTPASVRNLYYR